MDFIPTKVVSLERVSVGLANLRCIVDQGRIAQ
jgi:hypothetical protein